MMTPHRDLRPLLILLSACPSLIADDSAVSWRRTREWPAAEAHQAAAADETSLYAITNSAVARYDRRTGDRIAVSTGAARHLNSGFFHEGRLYCAHSNYPVTPERSQIMVLEVDSMELSMFHDFGDFGGSLTWAVRHDGGWWCNFARYGDRNNETFLVRFDDRWRETARWTYPEELIARLGRYSLSGGLWRGDHLLVTGHDDPVMFRLALPSEGSVLRFVDAMPAPLTGQGIAADPVTGGLVGIDRRRRRIILASPCDGAAFRPVACEKTCPKHLQGICTNDCDALYWSFTDVLLKTDRQGHVLNEVPVADHHGDLCFHDGRIYVAVNLGEFNQPAGRADSWVYVYDAATLEELERHNLPEVVHGAGGIACDGERFLVVGGLPDGVNENYLYEYDPAFRFRQRHDLDSGHTHLGIQTAAYFADAWWFGCYGTPTILLTADTGFRLIGRYEFDCSLGVTGLPDGRVFVARGRCADGRCSGEVLEAIRNEDHGLVFPSGTEQ